MASAQESHAVLLLRKQLRGEFVLGDTGRQQPSYYVIN